MAKLVLTLTVNPAIDRIFLVDRLVFEDRGYILSTTEAAGGRGINAARVLTSFGTKVLAITTTGDNGTQLEDLLERDGFEREFVKIKHPIRTNLTISDRQGLSVKLNERGPTLSDFDSSRIIKAVAKVLPKASWLMLCGSVPPGLDAKFYTKLIQLATENKVETMLDTDGDPLLYGIEAGPTIVTPNQSEAERLLNRALITRSHSLEAVAQLQQMGAKLAVLSLGSRGVVAATQNEVLEVLAPRVEALCPIGAGDALGAAIVWSLNQGDSFAESLRWGVSAGTASAQLPGVTLANMEQTKALYPQTHVTVVSRS